MSNCALVSLLIPFLFLLIKKKKHDQCSDSACYSPNLKEDL